MNPTTQNPETVPLVYFFGGGPIPSYANRTFRHVSSRWKGEVVVLHSHAVPRKMRGITYLDYTEWYDGRSFEKYKFGSPLEESFRQGFWYFTAERFYVLAQWAKREGVARFLHAELDVALYGVENLPDRLDSCGEGIFYPRASADFAGASLFYVNSIPALEHFLRFAGQNSTLGYEMRVLAAFNDAHPEKSFALPSHSSIEIDWGERRTWEGLDPSDIGGIVDVGAIGTWMLGNDPRNLGSNPHYNKATVDGHGNENFAKLRFAYSLRRRTLEVGAANSRTHEIKALHVHSKSMRNALSPWRLAPLTWILRLPWRFPMGTQNLHRAFFRYVRLTRDFVYVRCRKLSLDLSKFEPQVRESAKKEPR